jgi:hypothetical protein
VLGVYRYAYGDKEIELDPKRSLKRGTRYTVKVTTGVNDGANNLEAPYSWSFKIRTCRMPASFRSARCSERGRSSLILSSSSAMPVPSHRLH